MQDIEGIIKPVAKIYSRNACDAEEYLGKARKLKEEFGPRFAVVYCCFCAVEKILVEET